jgi:tetratricopeptide (TPR) repeat protein
MVGALSKPNRSGGSPTDEPPANVIQEVSVKRSLALSIAGLLLVVGLTPGPAGADESRLAQALASLTDQLEERPRNAGLLADYGNLLVRGGQFDAALEAYKSSLEIEPKSLTTLYNLGLLETELGRRRAAGRHLRRTVKIDPSFSRGHYALGTLLAARHRYRRAVERYSTAFTLDPGLLDVDQNPELLFNDLTTWASMHAYLASSIGRGTRLYDDPLPIVGLLIPGFDELVALPADPEPGVETEDD